MLARDFFARNPENVARDLVGCKLVVDKDGEKVSFQITETEAYLGEEDAASHARFGQTERSSLMYGPAGVLYVYLIYGMHHMLNIVTRKEGEPGAVLIRGVVGARGPGKLTAKLGITKEAHNGKLLGSEGGVWIEVRAEDFDPKKIQATPRVGIDYASKEWREKLLRFILEKRA